MSRIDSREHICQPVAKPSLRNGPVKAETGLEHPEKRLTLSKPSHSSQMSYMPPIDGQDQSPSSLEALIPEDAQLPTLPQSSLTNPKH